MLRVLLAVALLASVLLGCRPPEDGARLDGTSVTASGVSVSIEVPSSARIGRTPVQVTVTRESEGVSGAQVRVVGDMTHAGMIPVVRDAVEEGPGVYVSDDFTFDMAGDWVVTAEVILPDGERASAARPVAVSR